jgi:succinate-semialdehyde dehydrogenase/glutarate-semialdehyde dehydrogenase
VNDTSIQSVLRHLGDTQDHVALINPVSGKRITDLPQHSAEQVEAVIRASREYAKTWSQTSARERAQILMRTHDVMFKNQDMLLDVLQLETGKSRAHAFEEFAGATGAARYYGKHAPKFLRREKTTAGVPLVTKTWVEHDAVGVVGVITPWNYPMALTMLDVLPALAAGNAVVQKADNQTALTTLFCRMMAIEAGLPEEAWTVVVGDGATVGNAITDNVDYVAFTGSTNTGRFVAERASRRLIGYSLELGGKNPMIVLPGANLGRAAELAIGAAFGSAGQLCVSTERVYVHKNDGDAFLAELTRRTDELVLGKTGHFDSDIGSLTSAAQMSRVQGFIEDATAQGARVLSGGVADPNLGPNFFRPTILVDVSNDARMFKNEVFGPVIAVESYDNIDEAVDKANDTEFGLNASVIGNEAEALKVASRLKAGSVNVNEGFRASFASMGSPMGGMKHSGMGRRNGRYGILRYTDSRTVGVARYGFALPTRGRHYKTMAPLMKVLSALLKRFG